MTHKKKWRIYTGLLLIALLSLLSLVFLHPLRMSLDVAMYLEVGNFLLDGRTPYVDYYEVNPPLIHYLNIIPTGLARLLGMNPITAMLCLVVALIAWSTLYIRHLLQRNLPEPDPLSVHILPISLALVCLLITLLNMSGQREQLFILLYMPFFVVRWLRWEGPTKPVQTGRAIGLGILAGIGACLKPHFLPAVFLPELYWFVKHRQLKHFIQPEFLSLTVTGLLYGVHFLLLPPASQKGFFELMLPGLLGGYGSYGQLTIFDFLNSYSLTGLSVLILAVILWPIRQWQGKIWHLSQPLALFGLTSFVGFVIQAKGWAYQRIPFDIAIMSTATLLFITTRWKKPYRVRAGYSIRRIRLALVPLTVLVLVMLVVNLTAPEDTVDSDLQEIILTHTETGARILSIDTIADPTFPTLMQNNRHTVTSFLVSFPLSIGFYGVTDEAQFYDQAAAIPSIIEIFLDTTQKDVEQYTPAMIMIRQGACYACPPGFDIVRFLEARGFIEAVIEPEYDRLEAPEYDDFAIWLRNDEL